MPTKIKENVQTNETLQPSHAVEAPNTNNPVTTLEAPPSNLTGTPPEPGAMPQPPAARDSTPAPGAHTEHRRNGKIARLPTVERDLVNLMIRDGETYPAI